MALGIFHANVLSPCQACPLSLLIWLPSGDARMCGDVELCVTETGTRIHIEVHTDMGGHEL